MQILTAARGLIFRICHKDNFRWIIRNGLHCRSSDVFDPSYVNIGNVDLIDKRSTREIFVPPGGTLSDYVPFYFTPASPMLLNIVTGRSGVVKRSNDDIIIFACQLPKLREAGARFLFTDRHAYLTTAKFHTDLSELSRAIDWPLLQARDFRRDPEDPGKFERYQAEALVYQRVPLEHIRCVACHSEAVASQLREAIVSAKAELEVLVRKKWYF